MKQYYYAIEFISQKSTFKPYGWSQDWLDKQSAAKNRYYGRFYYNYYSFSLLPIVQQASLTHSQRSFNIIIVHCASSF